MSKENLNFHISDVIRGPEQLPQGVDYPTLVRLVGGKAAGLLLIQKYLPDVPTPQLHVYPALTDPQDIYNDVLRNGMKPPLLIRASSQFDDLEGFEDAFPTLLWNLQSEAHVCRLIEMVATHIREGLPEVPLSKRSIIISPFDKRSNPCVMVAHPNSERLFIAKTEHYPNFQAKFELGWVHRTYEVYEKKPESIQLLDQLTDVKFQSLYFRDMVCKLVTFYYDQIMKKIPGLNQDYSYQMEFGDHVPQIFQIRRFMKKEVAKKETKGNLRNVIMVFGVTPPEGLLVQVCDVHLLPLPMVSEKINNLNQQIPQAFICDLREPSKNNFSGQVYFIAGGKGIFQHDDIRFLRQAKLTVVLSSGWLDIKGKKGGFISDGEIVRIFSDGYNVRIERTS